MPLAPTLPHEILRSLRQQQVVGDGRELLRISPRLLQQPQFAFQRAALLLLVERHLQGKPGRFGHVRDQPGPVNLYWRSTPDSEQRVRLIDEAVQQGFDVLVVTLSDPEALSEVVREAVVIGVTVFVVNVGDTAGAELGVDSYFGQVETVAGLAVGDRLAEVGSTHLLCVRHEVKNVALETRCNRAGSRTGEWTDLIVDPAGGVEEQISSALTNDPTIDSVLTMNTLVMNAAASAIEEVRASQPGGRTVVHAVFELNDEVLDAIEDGRVEFAVDQQPYLQGYLPVAYARLVQYSELTQGDELADAMLQWIAGRGVLLGPGFVDINNVQRVREATQRTGASVAAGEQSNE